jgi:large subunit ribosomal protein L32
MAHPKRKISKTRRDKRRTHYKATAPGIATCANCGDTKLSHQSMPKLWLLCWQINVCP